MQKIARAARTVSGDASWRVDFGVTYCVEISIKISLEIAKTALKVSSDIVEKSAKPA